MGAQGPPVLLMFRDAWAFTCESMSPRNLGLCSKFFLRFPNEQNEHENLQSAKFPCKISNSFSFFFKEPPNTSAPHISLCLPFLSHRGTEARAHGKRTGQGLCRPWPAQGGSRVWSF